jgi:hypothetical protein
MPKPNDTMVSVASTGLDGMTDHVVVKASHAGLPHHAEAIAQTIAFLREGRFKASVPPMAAQEAISSVGSQGQARCRSHIAPVADRSGSANDIEMKLTKMQEVGNGGLNMP